ncbi:hypothetical protein SNE40_009207 [Patella caerulea]|uniref:CxC1-like cysteine cluster associated with KDZ transposases domain-containing protein n=2 Tax=Patella caerulea TaxID=87958 RepID=A0AAN8JT31_PATCE
MITFYLQMPIYKRKLVKKFNVVVSEGGKRSRRTQLFDPSHEHAASAIPLPIPLTDSTDEPMIDSAPDIDYDSAFCKKKQQRFEYWTDIQSKLLHTHIEEMCPASNVCRMCGISVPEIIFCIDCGPSAYYCSECNTKIHDIVVFHSPQIWKGEFYVPLLMKNIFSRFDEHNCGTEYMSTIYAVDVKGSQHLCSVQLCRCEDTTTTLMRYRLWPSSPQKPRIAFDLRFMELLTVLLLESHLPAKSFCDAIDHLQTDFIPYSENFPKNIYRAVVGDCLREYVFHRSSLKSRYMISPSTFGRECPICLKEPPIISFDANFGLVHKSSSGDGHGKSSSRHNNFLFVDPGRFKNFVDDYNVDKESVGQDCSNFQAGNVLRSKLKNKKLDVKGLFGSICKHDLPYLFIDMEEGERLAFAVFVLERLVEDSTNDDKIIAMYDIACMLHKHLKKNKRDDILAKVSFAVPVFHSFAHNMQCQLNYGQRFVEETGTTDGEGIERLWSYLRRFKSITKEMSYDNRSDLLTESLLHHSDKVISNIGKRLFVKLSKAEQVVQDTPLKSTEEQDMACRLLEEWKAEAVVTKIDFTANERFIECIHKIKEKRQELVQSELDVSIRNQKQIDIVSLTKDLKRIRGVDEHLKRQGENMSFECSDIRNQLDRIFDKRKLSSLLKLKTLAVERQYIGSLMKKYADGQALGVRLGKQFSKNFVKMERELEILNSHSKVLYTFNNISSPASELYEDLKKSSLNDCQQLKAQSFAAFKHAKFEIESSKQEITKLHHYLLNQQKTVTEYIETSKQQLNSSKYHRGLSQYYFKIINKIYEILCNSKPCFDSIGISIDAMLSDHRKIVNQGQSFISPIPNDEILEEIEFSTQIEDCIEDLNEGSDDDEDNL